MGQKRAAVPKGYLPQNHGKGGVEILSLFWAAWLQGSALFQPPVCTLLAVVQGTGKGAMSPGGKGPPQGLIEQVRSVL